MKSYFFPTAIATLAIIQPSHAFLLMNNLIAYERFDPIVQPGVVSGHLHAITGNSAFRETYSQAVWNNAKCSTSQVQENKSNYWMPSMMARHDNGSFSALPLYEARIYYRNHVSCGNQYSFYRNINQISSTLQVANSLRSLKASVC